MKALSAAKYIGRRILPIARGNITAVGETAAQPPHSQIRPLVDLDWYSTKYPGAEKDLAAAAEHYLDIGAAQGRNPSEFFWTTWYLATNPDVAQSGLNPLLHYVAYGESEGRNPSPLFETSWYRRQYLQDAPGVSPLAHFLSVGRREGNAPRPEAVIKLFMSAGGNLGHTAIQIKAIGDKVTRHGSSAYLQARLENGRQSRKRLEEYTDTWPAGGVGCQISNEIEGAKATLSPPYFATICNAVVFPGSSNIYLGEGVVLNDEVSDLKSFGGRQRELKLSDRNWLSGDDILIRYDVDATPRIPRGIHLFKEYEQNFFHFVTEIAFRLFMLERESLVDPDIPLLVSDDLDPRLYDLIDLLKLKSRPVLKLRRNVPYSVARLHYLSDVSRISDAYEETAGESHTFLSRSLLNEFSASVVAAVRWNGVMRRRKLFLLRASKHRAVLNQAELAKQALRAGYEVVNFDQLSLAAQINLMVTADAVVAPTGAALTNLLWCGAGTTAVALYPIHELNNTTFWESISLARGIDISFLKGPRAFNVEGRYSMHDDFTISPSDLQRYLV